MSTCCLVALLVPATAYADTGAAGAFFFRGQAVMNGAYTTRCDRAIIIKPTGSDIVYSRVELTTRFSNGNACGAPLRAVRPYQISATARIMEGSYVCVYSVGQQSNPQSAASVIAETTCDGQFIPGQYTAFGEATYYNEANSTYSTFAVEKRAWGF